MRSRYRLGLRAAITVEGGPDASESGKGPIIAEREPDHVLFLRFRIRPWRVLREAVECTKHRFSGFSHPRQCGDDVLRMLVTDGPPVRGGGGMPHRIMLNSRPVSVLRHHRGRIIRNTPGIGARLPT